MYQFVILCFSVRHDVCLSVKTLFFESVCLSIHRSVNSLIRRSVCPFISRCVCVRPSVAVSDRQSLVVSVSQSVVRCLSLHNFDNLSVDQSIVLCTSVRRSPSILQSVDLFVYPARDNSVYRFVRLPSCFSITVTPSLSVCPSSYPCGFVCPSSCRWMCQAGVLRLSTRRSVSVHSSTVYHGPPTPESLVGV